MAMKTFTLLASVVAIAITVTPPPSFADQTTATGGGEVKVLDLQSSRRTNHGQLDACEISYLVAFADHIYRRGDVTALRGAISMMGFTDQKDKQPAMILKVTAFDMVNGKPQFAPLDYVYLSVGGQSFAGKEFTKFQCEDGGVCVGYTILDKPELADLNSSFEISLTRPGGKSDVTVPINILETSLKAYSDYNECSIALINEILKKVGK